MTFSVSFALTFLLLYMVKSTTSKGQQDVVVQVPITPIGTQEPGPGPSEDQEHAENKKPKTHKVAKSTKHRVAKVTAYTKNCKGCSGVTKDGTVADYRKSILAADTRYHPIGTKVELLIPGSGRRVFTVRDTGGDIKGPNRFDILVSSKSEARAWGVRRVEFRILD